MTRNSFCCEGCTDEDADSTTVIDRIKIDGYNIGSSNILEGLYFYLDQDGNISTEEDWELDSYLRGCKKSYWFRAAADFFNDWKDNAEFIKCGYCDDVITDFSQPLIVKDYIDEK